MLYWETADQDPSLDDSEIEWAALWKPLPKVVFSTTLSAVLSSALQAIDSILTLSIGILATGFVMLRGGFGRAAALVGVSTGVLASHR